MDLNRTVTLSCLHCWYSHGSEQNCHPLLFTLLILTWNWTELSPSLVYTADTHMDLNRTVTLSCLHCWYSHGSEQNCHPLLFTLLILTWIWTELSPSLVYTADTHMDLNRTVTLSCLHCWYSHGSEQNCHPLLFTLLILTWNWTELSPSLVYTADTHIWTLSLLIYSQQNCHPLLFTWNWTELSPSLVYTADTHMELNRTVTLSCLHCWYPHGTEQNCHPLLFTLLILTLVYTAYTDSHGTEQNCHPLLFTLLILTWIWTELLTPLLFTLLIPTWIWTELSTISCLHCWYSHGTEHCWYSHGTEQNCHPLLFTLLILTWIWTKLSPSLVYTADTHMELNKTVTLSCLHCWYSHGTEQNCHHLLFTLLILTWIWTELLTISCLHCWYSHGSEQNCHPLLFTLLILTWIWTELSPSLVYTADTHMELNRTIPLSCLHCWYSHGSEQNC